jgi:predicted Fe-Mo cluster-binding NifX family protein
MKICFTSRGPDLSSDVDPRFGRARYFVVYDDETESHEVIDNEKNLNAAAGAGIQSAMNVVQTGCEWVVSGHMGPKALTVLKEAGIKIGVGASGSVSDAIKQFAAGEIHEVDSADVPPHW